MSHYHVNNVYFCIVILTFFDLIVTTDIFIFAVSMATNASCLPGATAEDKLRLAASKGQLEKVQEFILEGAAFDADKVSVAILSTVQLYCSTMSIRTNPILSFWVFLMTNQLFLFFVCVNRKEELHYIMLLWMDMLKLSSSCQTTTVILMVRIM